MPISMYEDDGYTGKDPCGKIASRLTRVFQDEIEDILAEYDVKPIELMGLADLMLRRAMLKGIHNHMRCQRQVNEGDEA